MFYLIFISYYRSLLRNTNTRIYTQIIKIDIWFTVHLLLVWHLFLDKCPAADAGEHVAKHRSSRARAECDQRGREHDIERREQRVRGSRLLDAALVSASEPDRRVQQRLDNSDRHARAVLCGATVPIVRRHQSRGALQHQQYSSLDRFAAAADTSHAQGVQLHFWRLLGMYYTL